MKSTPECERAVAAILEGGAPEHAAGCPRCSELLAAHRAAAGLASAESALPRPLEPAGAIAVARRRRLVRRAAGASLCLALGVGAFLFAGRREATDTGAPVADLVAEVRSYARRDPVREDVTYVSFGPLPGWLAPPAGGALEADPFRKVFPWEGKEEVTP
ncbi:MAG: hypothetical protein HYZ28_20530 [Myxococcales bacterium]|nr:hypothetical protein [Myxococcales bacterium]